jgi:hypothetical protein
VFLTRDELVRLTGRKRYSAQRRELDRRGIKYIPAASGEPLVRDRDLDAAGQPAHRPRSPHRWDLIGSVRQLKP